MASGQEVLAGEQAVEVAHACPLTCLLNSFGHEVTVLHALLTVHKVVVNADAVQAVTVVHADDVAVAVVLPAVSTP